MFMGDSGSQILGVFLSFMAIDFCWNVPTDITSSIENFTPIKNILIAITVFILPLSDTLTVFINRIVRGNSPFVGGKDHTTHHLFYKGITEKRIAILYSIIGLSATVLAGSLILKKTTEFLNYIYFLIFPILVFSALYLNTVIRKKQK
jgi:UDP-GlcNAc:undecaprenyl-phosphate GlcNAc-1-phosphate transferase